MTKFQHTLSDAVGALQEETPSRAVFPMPIWREKHLRAATRAAGVALWAWNVDTDAIAMDEVAYDL